MFSTLEKLSRDVGQVLLQHQAMLSSAESCTGGLVASTIIDTAGSSQWFERGFVTYTNQAKMDVLGVKEETLRQYGAVSIQTAAEMAMGVLRNVQTHTDYANHYTQWAVSTTGVAGPTGGTAEKPVGMVCFGIARRKADGAIELVQTSTKIFVGNRTTIRQQSVQYVLETLIQLINDNGD